jgi:hypothetical protein
MRPRPTQGCRADDDDDDSCIFTDTYFVYDMIYLLTAVG